MKNLLTPSRTVAMSLLLGGWACAGAQSLGTPVADVLLGQPLAMTVPARFASRDGADECVHADVFYGERRVPDGHVRAFVTGPGPQRRVRIESEALIDEPVVTVSLRAGCSNTVTRSYTLLPEYPSEARLAAIEARSVAAAAAPPLRLATAARPAPAAKPAPVVRRSAPRQHARLKLEPIEADPQPLLRVSSSLAQPQGDAARRAGAALLWQAINADPQELLRTGAMLHKLEADLAQMRRTNQQTRAEVLALRQRLDRPGTGPGWMQWLQFAALLVAAAAAAAGALWYRTRRQPWTSGAWYGGDVAGDVAGDDAAVAAEPLVAKARVAAVASPAAPVPVQEPPPMRRSAEGALRVEALAATFEEVAFLSSLGLASDAMDVLKSYLQDSASPAPIAFFELMRRCDTVEDAESLAAARRRYLQAFGIAAPRLEQLTACVGLESLTALAGRIGRAWGTAAARAVIEDALFAVPAADAPLTLQAGRDLLDLHALATTLEEDAATSAGGECAAQTLAPWAQAAEGGAAAALACAAPDVQGGPHFALDVDLGAASAARPEPLRIQVPPAPDPLLAELQAAAERECAERERAARRAAEEEAFSAAVACERMPVSRF